MIIAGILGVLLLATLGLGYYWSTSRVAPVQVVTQPVVDVTLKTERSKPPSKTASLPVKPSDRGDETNNLKVANAASVRRSEGYEARPPERVPDVEPVTRRTERQSSGSGSSATGFKIGVFSRTHSIQDGTSFSYGDQTLGELAHGDIKCMITVEGQLPPRAVLTLEWVVDGVVMSKGAVTPGRITEYGNEPTAGTYVATLYNDGRPVQKFTFRISK